MKRLFRVAVFLLLSGFAPLAAGAQEATPSADFVTPDPADCTIQPRTVEELRGFLATPTAPGTPMPSEGTPAVFTAPEGEPADDAVVAAVTDTVNEQYACLNANAFLRMFALYSDAYVARSLVQEDVASEALGLFATPIAPQAADERASVAVRDVRVLSDGRVGAFVVSTSPLGDGSQSTAYYIFVEQDGRYLIDDMATLPAGGDEAIPTGG